MASGINNKPLDERKVGTARKLTKEELEAYGGAVIAAANWVPVFRDSIALLRPFVDMTAETAYTDRYARVGLSSWFFYKLNDNQRASVILHEVMHCLNNHFQRAETSGFTDPKASNIAGDFEINCGIDKLDRSDLKFAVFPDQHPWNLERYRSMENYYGEVKKHMEELEKEFCQCDSGHEDCEGDGENGQGDNASSGSNSSSNPGGGGQASPGASGSGEAGEGEGSTDSGQEIGGGLGDTGDDEGTCDCCGKQKYPKRMCDEASDQRSSAADEAGIERASDAEQTIARNNSMTRMIDELNSPTKGRGDGSMQDFLEYTQRYLTKPKVNWKNVLRKTIARQTEAIIKGRVDYSYRRSNRKTSNSEFIYPSLVQYVPTIMFAFDTSGSMGRDDYMTILTEVEGLMKENVKGKDALKVFSIDTEVKKVVPVRSVSDVKFQGGGGTDMSVGVAYVNNLPKKTRPDIFALATDGYTAWAPYIEEAKRMKAQRVGHVLIVTEKGGYETVPQELKTLCTVIDASGNTAEEKH